MKRLHLKYLIVLQLIVLFSCGASNIKIQVLFEQQPDIYGNQLIYYNNTQIGKSSSAKLMPDGQSYMVNIVISSDYKKLLHSNSTFYTEDGKLNLYHFKEEGDPLITGSKYFSSIVV